MAALSKLIPDNSSPTVVFLSTPPRRFLFPVPQRSPVGAAYIETKEWAESTLKGLRLDATEWKWLLDPTFRRWLADVNTRSSQAACPTPQEPTFLYPYNEAMTSSAALTQIVHPVASSVRSYLSNENLPDNLFLQMQVLEETTSRKDVETPHTKSQAKKLSDGKAAYDEVRLDLVVTASPIKGKPDAPTGFFCADVFERPTWLPRNTVWHEGSDDIPGNLFMHKALLVVEMKDWGRIPADTFAAYATSKIPVGHAETLKDKGAIAVRALLQQTARYSNHYGTKYVVICDYEALVALIVPPVSNTKRPVYWAVARGGEAKLLLAYMVARSCQDLKELHKEEALRRAAKKQAFEEEVAQDKARQLCQEKESNTKATRRHPQAPPSQPATIARGQMPVSMTKTEAPASGQPKTTGAVNGEERINSRLRSRQGR